MIAVAVFAVVMYVLIALPAADWVGGASIPLEFLVLDATTGRPIEGASLRLVLEEGRDPEYEATTGADGQAKVCIRAMTYGQSFLLRSTRFVRYHWTLIITADHHVGATLSLYELTRGARYHSDPAPPPIVIRLDRE
jgi:hypothetical protein